jgi:hypothetical protein
MKTSYLIHHKQEYLTVLISICALKLCFILTATGVFTPTSIQRDAAALWKEIPEPIQKDYTKAYFDGFIKNMIKYSTCGVSYTVKP